MDIQFVAEVITDHGTMIAVKGIVEEKTLILVYEDRVPVSIDEGHRLIADCDPIVQITHEENRYRAISQWGNVRADFLLTTPTSVMVSTIVDMVRLGGDHLT